MKTLYPLFSKGENICLTKRQIEAVLDSYSYYYPMCEYMDNDHIKEYINYLEDIAKAQNKKQ